MTILTFTIPINSLKQRGHNIMDGTQSERRGRMLEKVRKLLAMARDGRGNDTEEETAMRQANKLMAEFGIEEAEVDMAALDAGTMSFGEALAGMDGRAPEAGKVYKSYSTWVGMLAVGVAKFTDSIASRKTTENGEMLVFRGEKNDVLMARLLLGVLVAGIHREQKASGWTGRGNANEFRVAASNALCKRLRALADERRAMYQAAASTSRALVVVDRKANQVATLFGAQRTKSARSSYSASSGAYMAGASAGQRINIPAGRPIAQQQRARLN
jgi:hypothetical protein